MRVGAGRFPTNDPFGFGEAPPAKAQGQGRRRDLDGIAQAEGRFESHPWKRNGVKVAFVRETGPAEGFKLLLGKIVSVVLKNGRAVLERRGGATGSRVVRVP